MSLTLNTNAIDALRRSRRAAQQTNQLIYLLQQHREKLIEKVGIYYEVKTNNKDQVSNLLMLFPFDQIPNYWSSGTVSSNKIYYHVQIDKDKLSICFTYEPLKRTGEHKEISKFPISKEGLLMLVTWNARFDLFPTSRRDNHNIIEHFQVKEWLEDRKYLF